MASSREVYIVTGADLESIKRQLNGYLSRLADRVDKLEGLRGEFETQSGTFEGDVIANASVIVNDESGDLIHSME